MAEVIWSGEALDRLQAIQDYISHFNPVAAERIARRLRAAGDSLEHFPRRGRPASADFRELPTVPPYIIRYIVLNDVVLVTNVYHGRQRR